METKATWKRVGKAALAIVLVIALSAGTALFIHRRSGVPTAAMVKNGLSAYELAVAEGYSGTMQEWLASLRGQSAYALAQEAGYTGSEADWAARLAKLAQSDPVSLTAANFNNRGQLILTLSDGTTLNLGNAVGENGKNGSDGRNGTDGKNGADGKDGKDGLNGVSVSGVDLTDAGELVLRFSDDRMVNVGRVTGAQGIQGEKGEKGDTGAQGAQGEKGEKGDTGAQGAQGEKGEKGDTGAQGAQGDKGEKGDTGAQGAQGEKGEKGDTGAQGIQGEKGEKGDTGAQGIQGEKGEKGDTGAQGIQGEKGEKGDTGAQGIQGEKGEKGDTGAQGVQGEKGERGDTGAQGIQGEKGEKGDTGAQGAQGEKGDKGDTGAAGNGIQTIRLVDGTMTVELTDGSKFTFENVRGENGADGVSPQVRINAATNQWEISADEGENWVSTGVQATGARGEAGAPGEKGEKGDKGDPGQNGVSPRVMIDPASREWKISTDNGLTWMGTGISATGEKGEKGDTGAQGAQGEKGEKGDTGAQGAQGEKGEKGDTGVSVTGVTLEDYKLVVTLSDGTVLRLEQSLLGATGAKGDTGAQGVQGEKGEKGDTGADGRGIERVVLTAEGCLIFEYTDGTKSEPTASLMGAQGAKGDKGDTGADGRGIVTVSLNGGDLYVTYSDSATPVRIGTVRGEKGDKGDPGAQGEKGDPGVDGKSAYELYKAAYPDYTGTLTEWLASLKGDTGRGIQKTEIVDGKLIVTYTDGTQEDLGSITAGDPSASPDDYFVFTLLEDGTYGVRISETHKSYVKEVIIPSAHNGKAVTAILNSGFSGCKNLEEITMPETVKILERYAFRDCAMLKSVVLPDSIESIGGHAFQGCTSLSFVQLPINPNFTKLGEQIGTSSLGNVRMSYVFSGCSSLKKIRIPKSVMDIAFDCFEKTGLEELELEETAGWKSYRYFDSTYGTSIAFGNDAKENARIFMTKVENVNWEGTLMKRTVE